MDIGALLYMKCTCSCCISYFVIPGQSRHCIFPALWSTRLALTHPVTGKPIDVSCPPPDAWPWNLFA